MRLSKLLSNTFQHFEILEIPSPQTTSLYNFSIGIFCKTNAFETLCVEVATNRSPGALVDLRFSFPSTLGPHYSKQPKEVTSSFYYKPRPHGNRNGVTSTQANFTLSLSSVIWNGMKCLSQSEIR